MRYLAYTPKEAKVCSSISEARDFIKEKADPNEMLMCFVTLILEDVSIQEGEYKFLDLSVSLTSILKELDNYKQYFQNVQQMPFTDHHLPIWAINQE